MTLTQTAILTKQIILASTIILSLGITALIGYNIWHAYYIANLPPVEEKPDLKFGLLPPPDFPQGSISTSNFSYSLDTITGGLPKTGIDSGFEKISKVYFITQTFVTLLSPDRSRNLAEKFGIQTDPEILSETKYKFSENEKSLVVNLDTGNFSYLNEATMSAGALTDESKLINGFKQILSNLGVLKNDFANARSKTILSPETKTAQVSLWPAPLEQKTIYTSDFNKSLITAKVLGSADQLVNYQSLDFTYYPIDTSIFATYTTKPAEIAFDDLKNGKGVVIVEPKTPQVSITSVSIGYYLPEKYTPYLQPIFVFEGPGFVAYVSAINELTEIKATQN